MTAGSLASWLRCPICGRDLDALGDEVLGCSSGHRFDVSKRGYAGLLVGKAAAARPVTVGQLDALDPLFAAGLFTTTTDALDAVLPRTAEARILDAGSAAGHLLGPILANRSRAGALAVGDSPAVVARSMRNSRSDGLLCDTAHDWPVRDGTATAVVNLLAPHRPAEFHRLLAPGGVFIAAVAGYDHLAELRPAGEYPEWRDAAAELVDDVFPWFEHDQSRTVTEQHETSGATGPALVEARELIGGTATARAVEPPAGSITIDLTVIRFRRRRRPV
ncbi:putative RNA methyltransferase [Amnibacterium flavum]|uniref:23S rRNA (guanine(745)-N(1))-methyltransferase N-terminal domain-containing protein n=1 Tax=Amnibacterium flavum TaxID=2173173 RepID=A0A2V1HSJ3_9MICO|nr:hypothetical protein [Amnibacterium flavum]PVZ95301.1 hypothetical protein DDQ50_01905 [Amnibacterium flavum]